MKAKIDLSNLPHVTNECYYPLYADRNRYMVLKGGGSSGKSVFAAQKHVFRCLTEKGHKFLVVRKVKEDLRDSCFAEIVKCIESWGLSNLFKIPEGRSSTLHISSRINDNEILFYGLDDVERRKSIEGITSIWVEEASELQASDFRQLDIRMRAYTPHYRQMVLSFNPISITHWLKSEFFDKKKKGSTVLETTYKNNRFLDQASIDVLESFRDTDEYYYMVYCLGEWGIVGKTVYDAQRVTARLLEVRNLKPAAIGRFEYKTKTGNLIDWPTVKFVRDKNGPLVIYEPPQRGYPYVLGGDIAEGGTNWSVGSVRNNASWNQAAVWRDQTDTDVYAQQMACLGRFYNDALVGIETNFETHPVKELQRQGYGNQYAREQIDKYTQSLTRRYGWVTTKITRPYIIGQHVALVRDHIDTFNCPVTLDEMLTFVRNERGKPQAQEGKDDDCVLADAICLGIRDQQTKGVKVSPLPRLSLPHELQSTGILPPVKDIYREW